VENPTAQCAGLTEPGVESVIPASGCTIAGELHVGRKLATGFRNAFHQEGTEDEASSGGLHGEVVRSR